MLIGRKLGGTGYDGRNIKFVWHVELGGFKSLGGSGMELRLLAKGIREHQRHDGPSKTILRLCANEQCLILSTKTNSKAVKQNLDK